MKLKTKDIGFVILQCLLFATYFLKIKLYVFNSSALIGLIAIALALMGVVLTCISLIQLNTNLSPFPTPKSDSILITHGIYNYIRHPIYTGILSSFFGYGLYAGTIYKVIISILLLILFYFKSKYEEKELVKKFPNYRTYKKTTGRFLPKI